MALNHPLIFFLGETFPRRRFIFLAASVILTNLKNGVFRGLVPTSQIHLDLTRAAKPVL